MLALLRISGNALGEDIHHLKRVIGAVHQRGAHANLLEKRFHALHILAQRLHLHTVDDVGALHNQMGITFGTQAEHGLQRTFFLNTACFQPSHNDARRVTLAHFQLRKHGLCFLINGINGLAARVVIGGSEVHHQQCRLVVLLQGSQQITFHERRQFLCMNTHAQEHQND